MKTVSVTEFRSNIKKYLNIAETEKLVIHRNKSTSFVLVPLDQVQEEIVLLSQEQKKAIDEALESIAQGRVMTDAEARKKINKRHQNDRILVHAW